MAQVSKYKNKKIKSDITYSGMVFSRLKGDLFMNYLFLDQ